MGNIKKIPEGWALVELGEVLDYVQPSKYIVKSTNYSEQFKIPVLTAGKTFIIGYTNEEIGIFEDKLPVIIFDDFTTSTQYVNFKFKVKSSAMKILLPSTKEINLKYFFYLMQTINIKVDTHKRYWISQYSKENAPVAPQAEQHRIVSKIEELFSELDKGVESLIVAQQQLKVYRQAVLNSAYTGGLTKLLRQEKPYHCDIEKIKELVVAEFKDSSYSGAKKRIKSRRSLGNEICNLPDIPDNWCSLRLFEIADIAGGITKGRDFNGKQIISLPYLSVANVQDGYLNLNEIKKIELLETETSRYVLQVNDVLYTEGGDRDKLGRGTIWKGEVDNCVHQNHIFRARAFTSVIVPKYLAYYSQTKIAKDYFFRNAKQTVNLASINMTILSNLPVPIPNLIEQEQIVQEIETRLSVCDKLNDTIEASFMQAEALRQSILKRAFEGKLVPQNPADESAEKLLERIRAELATNMTVKKASKRRQKQ